MAALSVVVVDDHPMLMDGIAALMRGQSDFSLVASGATADDIVTLAFKHDPDVMIVDLNMPGDAFEAIGEVIGAAPQTKIVVFTASSSTDHAIRALDAGASGYVLKGSSSDELLHAVRVSWQGEIYITPVFAAKVISALQARALEKRKLQNANLSVRESQIIKLLLCGKQNREIASALNLSEKTIKGYMTQLMQKLHARNRLEVVIAAQKLSPAVFEGARAALRPTSG